jgi:hypothetical protein
MNDYDEIINSSQRPKKNSNNWFYMDDDCDEKVQEINRLNELLEESLELLEEKEILLNEQLEENELLREQIKKLKLIPKDSSFDQTADKENLIKINDKILEINEKLENFIDK